MIRDWVDEAGVVIGDGGLVGEVEVGVVEVRYLGGCVVVGDVLFGGVEVGVVLVGGVGVGDVVVIGVGRTGSGGVQVVVLG